MTPAEIWKKLTPSQRVTLLAETHPQLRYGDLYRYGDPALERAGLKQRGHVTAALSSGSARHALGRKGLLDVGQTVALPTSAAGFHTPRKPTALGQQVADYGVSLLGAVPPHGAQKKTPSQLDREIAEVLVQPRRHGRTRDEVQADIARFRAEIADLRQEQDTREKRDRRQELIVRLEDRQADLYDLDVEHRRRERGGRPA
ncbi:MAG TPA: hypothetical protein VLE97_11595 [Gaiellaceae bacterium]|nr:hypothetical protein [Gaiellaceae bacterium]